MKDARSVVNAVFAFAIFLLLWTFVDPEVARSKEGARFLRMRIEEQHHGRRETRTINVPTFVVKGVMRTASLGRFHRQLDMHLGHDVPFETFREVWTELEAQPDGTVVERAVEDNPVLFQKDGTALIVTVKDDDGGEGQAVVRLPLAVVRAIMEGERDLDVDAVLAGLTELEKGDLVDVRDGDSHVRIWLE